MTALNFQEDAQPCWQSHVVEMDSGVLAFFYGFFNAGLVGRVGQGPDLVKSGDLIYQTPSQQALSAGKPRFPWRTTSEGAG